MRECANICVLVVAVGFCERVEVYLGFRFSLHYVSSRFVWDS